MEQDLLRVAASTPPGTDRPRARTPSKVPDPAFGVQIAAFYPYPQPALDTPSRPGAPDPRQRATQVSASSGIGKRRPHDDQA